jgi:hypothetical protein
VSPPAGRRKETIVLVRMRGIWLGGTIALTGAAFVVTILLAPPAQAQPVRAVQWLLFVGSSVHVAATGWFYSVPEIRRYAGENRQRYVLVPLGLVAGGAVLAALVSENLLTWLLLGFFGWQFYHFQKQNLGMVALAGVSRGAGSAGPGERRAIILTGLAGTAGLLVHPELLQLALPSPVRWLFPAAGLVFLGAVGYGLWQLRSRRRPAGFIVVYLISLLFFAPVFVFTSPYAAVAGLTIAHGYQYLLIVGLVAGARRPGRSALISLGVLVNVALLGGLALNAASHLHSAGPLGRAIFGAYLGVVMAHFVVDAGLWRLRDEFPRRFLTERVPYLLRPAQPEPDRPQPARSA